MNIISLTKRHTIHIFVKILHFVNKKDIFDTTMWIEQPLILTNQKTRIRDRLRQLFVNKEVEFTANLSIKIPHWYMRDLPDPVFVDTKTSLPRN